VVGGCEKGGGGSEGREKERRAERERAREQEKGECEETRRGGPAKRSDGCSPISSIIEEEERSNQQLSSPRASGFWPSTSSPAPSETRREVDRRHAAGESGARTSRRGSCLRAEGGAALEVSSKRQGREAAAERGGQGQGQGTRARESGGNQGLFLLAFKHLFRLCGFPGRSQRSSRRSPTGEGRKRAPPGKNAAARRGSDWPPPPPPLRRLLLLSTTRKTKKQPTHLSLFRSMITNGRHSRCLWGPGEGLGACFEFF
jgi:hypothetical protein